MIKGIIFDLDGTLLNTITDIANACNYALEKINLPVHKEEAYKTFVGDGRRTLIERMTPESSRNEETINSLLELFDSHYNKHMWDNTKPYEGIMELLNFLKENNYKTAVLSNKPHEFTTKIVDKFFKDSFSVVYGHRDGHKPKPHPSSLLEIIEALELNKDEVLYVGDSNVDIITAREAEVKSVGVLWGFRTAEELKKEGATYLAENPQGILERS